MTAHNLTVREIPLDEIDQHPENANNGDLDALMQSIETNGFYSPVLVQASTGYVIAGNHRVQAAHALGMLTIPGIYLDVDDEQAKRIMLADNRITRLGEDDPALLADLLEGLQESELGLIGTGFTNKDLQTLLDNLDQGLDFPEEPDAPATSGGDVPAYDLMARQDGDGYRVIEVIRKDGEELTVEDFQAIRESLGMRRANLDQLKEYDVDDWR